LEIRTSAIQNVVTLNAMVRTSKVLTAMVQSVTALNEVTHFEVPSVAPRSAVLNEQDDRYPDAMDEQAHYAVRFVAEVDRSGAPANYEAAHSEVSPRAPVHSVAGGLHNGVRATRFAKDAPVLCSDVRAQVFQRYLALVDCSYPRSAAPVHRHQTSLAHW
jgi:hypothetical protein